MVKFRSALKSIWGCPWDQNLDWLVDVISGRDAGWLHSCCTSSHGSTDTPWTTLHDASSTIFPHTQSPSCPSPLQKLKQLQTALHINYKHYLYFCINWLSFIAAPTSFLPLSQSNFQFSSVSPYNMARLGVTRSSPCSPSSPTTSISWPLLSESFFLGQSSTSPGPVSYSKTWI